MTGLRAAFLFAIGFAMMVGLWRPSDMGGAIAGLEGWTLDARFALRGERPAPEDLIILAIDDATLGSLDAFPPPRDALADAVRVAQRAGAKIIAFDLLLSGDGRGDAALSRALDQSDETILAVSLSDGFKVSEQTNSRATVPEKNSIDPAIARSALSLVIGAPREGRSGILGPAAKFTARSALAHVNVVREADGALRRVPLVQQAGGGYILPVLPLEAVRRYRGVARSDLRLTWGAALDMAGRRWALNPHNEVGVNFYGAHGAVETVSLINAQSAALAGKIVFIGATAEGYGDTFATPFDRDLPGVEVLATVAGNLLDNSVLRRDSVTAVFDVILAILAALICVWAASRAKPHIAIAATLLVWAGTAAILQAAFIRSIWLDGATLMISLLVATFLGGAARWMLHRQSAANLARYQSPLLSGVLATAIRPDFDGRVQKAAALFVDAADFTARSARLGPAQTTIFLKAFHACVERAALAHEGMVEQYAGDGAMICFGLPEPRADDAHNALRCADQLFAETEALSTALSEAGDAPVAIRIGAHYGDAAAAVLGGKTHGHVTLVGDVVNLASRLQEVAKDIGAELVVSDALVAAAGPHEDLALTYQGPHPLRGSADPLQIWARIKPQTRDAGG